MPPDRRICLKADQARVPTAAGAGWRSVIPATERTLPSYCHLLGRSRSRKRLPSVRLDPRTSQPKRRRIYQLCHGGGERNFINHRWLESVAFDPTSSDSPVRVASALAICSRLGWPAVGGSGRISRSGDVCERGGPCPAMWAR